VGSTGWDRLGGIDWVRSRDRDGDKGSVLSTRQPNGDDRPNCGSSGPD
jgi:hypothetical protein